MTPRLRRLVVTAVVVLGGYGAISVVYPGTRPWRTAAVPGKTASGDRAAERIPPPTQFQEKPATVEEPATTQKPAARDKPATAEKPAATDKPATPEKPAATEKPTTPERPTTIEETVTAENPSATEISATILIPPADEVGPVGRCPKKGMETILGVTISQPHGLCIGSVVPDGPAAKAGIKPGDRLGQPSDCPRSTIDRFLPGDEAREVRVTIRRSKQQEPDGRPNPEPGSGAGDQGAEAPPSGEPSP